MSKTPFQNLIFAQNCCLGSKNMTTGDLNQAQFFLGGSNIGAGKPLLLKNDHFWVSVLAPRQHAHIGLFIPNSRFKVKLGCLSDQASGQDVKNPIFKT
jgi:hypothetical protein